MLPETDVPTADNEPEYCYCCLWLVHCIVSLNHFPKKLFPLQSTTGHHNKWSISILVEKLLVSIFVLRINLFSLDHWLLYKRKRLTRGLCLLWQRTTQQLAIENRYWWNNGVYLFETNDNTIQKRLSLCRMGLLDQNSNSKAVMRGDRQHYTRSPYRIVTHLLSHKK